MVGWYDAVEKGDALRYGGFQDLMINKLDALTHAGDWKGDLLICTAYEDATAGAAPRAAQRGRAQVAAARLRALPGWAEDISQVRHFADLPANARRYVAGWCGDPGRRLRRRVTAQASCPTCATSASAPGRPRSSRTCPPTAELVKLA
jgi:adenylosuccinate synthase